MYHNYLSFFKCCCLYIRNTVITMAYLPEIRLQICIQIHLRQINSSKSFCKLISKLPNIRSFFILLDSLANIKNRPPFTFIVVPRHDWTVCFIYNPSSQRWWSWIIEILTFPIFYRKLSAGSLPSIIKNALHYFKATVCKNIRIIKQYFPIIDW